MTENLDTDDLEDVGDELATDLLRHPMPDDREPPDRRKLRFTNELGERIAVLRAGGM